MEKIEINDSVKETIHNPVQKTENLEIWRIFIVANRVVGTQAILLITTGILTSLAILLDIAEALAFFWFLFIISVILEIIFCVALKLKNYYYKGNWKKLILPLAAIWITITLPIGVAFDLTRGIGRTFIMSLYLTVLYVLGYLLSLTVWKINFKTSKNLVKISALFSFGLIVITLLMGILLLNQGLSSVNQELDSKNSGNFMAYPAVDLGVYIIISGFGIVISMLLNYWMLYSLEHSRNSTIYDSSPNQLIFKFLLRTVILTFIFWLCLEAFFPPIAGGGDDDNNGSSSSNTVNSKKIRKKQERELIKKEKTIIIQDQWRYLSK